MNKTISVAQGRNRNRNHHRLSVFSLNNESNIFSSHHSFNFYSLDPINSRLKKNYVELNRTSCRFPKIKQYRSSIFTHSSTIIQRKKKPIGVKFSQEDKEEIHNKASEYLMQLLQGKRNEMQINSGPRIQESKTERRLISINHIHTRILKEIKDCPMLKIVNEQIKCFGNEDQRQYKLKLIQNQLSERKYSPIIILENDNNKNRQLPYQNMLKEEFRNRFFGAIVNCHKINTNPKDAIKIAKIKLRSKFLSNRSVPKDFVIKNKLDDIYNEHRVIVNQINESIVNHSQILSNLKINKQLRNVDLHNV